MGVMACSRKGYNSVMCDTHTSEGYICYECKDEFKLYLKDKNLNPTTERDIESALTLFMGTSKDSYSEKGSKEISVDDFFSERTK